MHITLAKEFSKGINLDKNYQTVKFHLLIAKSLGNNYNADIQLKILDSLDLNKKLSRLSLLNQNSENCPVNQQALKIKKKFS